MKLRRARLLLPGRFGRWVVQHDRRLRRRRDLPRRRPNDLGVHLDMERLRRALRPVVPILEKREPEPSESTRQLYPLARGYSARTV